MMTPYTATNALWAETLRRMLQKKLTRVALAVVFLYIVVALLAHWGIIASDWNAEVGSSYEAPSTQHWFGTDIFGRSVLKKVMKATEVAMNVGFVVGIIAITLGVVLGALAGYFGGFVDELIVWLYSVLSSIPNIMLLIALSFILGKGILSVYIALGMTNWVELCRLIRGEVQRHKDREYVQAATAIGASHLRKLCIHILPNVLHIVIIQFSLIFQFAIKSEVILSYLGLGVQDSPSWGVMINDAKVELTRGIWWQLTFATLAMFLIVLAFNILSDAIRDALDPKLKGK
jgi:ABC-type dipeptide/oligopeptide/nickel transport system permease subunit